MIKKFICFYFLICVSSTCALASSLSISPDKQLFWERNPINPLCFDKLIDMEEDVDEVDLETCPDPRYKIIHTESKGRFYTDYARNEKSPSQRIEYEVIGRIKVGVVIHLFKYKLPSVVVVDIKDNKLIKIKEIYNGTGCSGGISNIEIKGNDLIVSKKLTQSRFFFLGRKYREYDPIGYLHYTPADCYGEQILTNDALSGVSLIDISSDFKTEGDTPDKCLNRLYVEQYKVKKDLNLQEYKGFIEKVYNQCGVIK